MLNKLNYIESLFLFHLKSKKVVVMQNSNLRLNLMTPKPTLALLNNKQSSERKSGCDAKFKLATELNDTQTDTCSFK
jgi:hypothetical protein